MQNKMENASIYKHKQLGCFAFPTQLSLVLVVKCTTGGTNWWMNLLLTVSWHQLLWQITSSVLCPAVDMQCSGGWGRWVSQADSRGGLGSCTPSRQLNQHSRLLHICVALSVWLSWRYAFISHHGLVTVKCLVNEHSQV